ncbi:hemin uptake protein HemP [Stappia indica]|uniref:Hemin uptake protein HemP n=1 Tax=Stappia indica TaxID=538381 RepID=A0A285TCE3_9HYPH|nr:hemin uptake protein HemP [Stappia indica]MCC4247142.1 hemin uptake protein HemP [Stappia indica]SOC19454.1 Hemin uptake protein HemP [Stappia indica]
MSQSANPASQASNQAQAAGYRRPRTQQRTLTLPKTAKVSQEPLELDSSALFQGAREVHIRHKDMVYRLSITRFEKLLLTK